MNVRPVQGSHEGTRGSGGIALFIPDPGNRWRCVFNFTLRLLYPRAKGPQYALNKTLGGLRNQFECFVVEIKLYSYNKNQRHSLFFKFILINNYTSMFRTDLLYIIRSLNTVFTATGICRASYVDRLLARSES